MSNKEQKEDYRKYQIDTEGLRWERGFNKGMNSWRKKWGLFVDASRQREIENMLREMLEMLLKESYVLHEPMDRQEVIQRLRYQVDHKVGKERKSIISEVNTYSFKDGTLRHNIWSRVLEPLETRVKEGKQ